MDFGRDEAPTPTYYENTYPINYRDQVLAEVPAEAKRVLESGVRIAQISNIVCVICKFEAVPRAVAAHGRRGRPDKVSDDTVADKWLKPTSI